MNWMVARNAGTGKRSAAAANLERFGHWLHDGHCRSTPRRSTAPILLSHGAGRRVSSLRRGSIWVVIRSAVHRFDIFHEEGIFRSAVRCKLHDFA
jgi:hypothetical protein